MSAVTTPKEPVDSVYLRAWTDFDQTTYEERWTYLRHEARKLFLDAITKASEWKMSVPKVRGSMTVVADLEDLKFVEFSKNGNKDGYAINEKALPFARRLLAIVMFSEPQTFEEWRNYVKYCLGEQQFKSRAEAVLAKEGRTMDVDSQAFWELVQTIQWPRMVARAFNNPTMREIIEDEALASSSIELFDYVNFSDESPIEKRESIATLILHGALMETLNNHEKELDLCLLPGVRNDLEKELLDAASRTPTPIEPTEQLHANKTAASDLRAVLLEVLRTPVRLRTDGDVFQKDYDRLATVIEPVANFSTDQFEFVDSAIAMAFQFQFLETRREGKRLLGTVSAAGENWLRLPTAEQVRWLFRQFTSLPNPSQFKYRGDGDFLMSHIAVKNKGEKRKPDKWMAESILQLRRSFHEAFKRLPEDKFVSLEQAVSFLSAANNNPLLPEGNLEGVEVYFYGSRIDHDLRYLIQVTREIITNLLRRRLVAMGCFGIAVRGTEILISRRRLLDLYFGEELTDEEITGLPDVDSKVVVQPDYSMIVIGNLPAVADFAPFTEPSSVHHDPHSSVLKVTRERVLSAAEQGLTAEQMIQRMEKHATVPIPKNVLQEIRHWAGSIRRVEVAPMLVFTCSEPSDADRLPDLLGHPGNRLSPTVVGFPPLTISAKTKAQLKKMGIHLKGNTDFDYEDLRKFGNRRDEW